MSSLSQRYVYFLVAMLLVGAAAYYIYLRGNDSDTQEQGITTGYLVTDVEIPLLEGETVTLSEYRGRVLVVDFMAPWCAPCREQFKVLKELHMRPGVEIITINIDSRYNSSTLSRFAEAEGITWCFGSSPLAGGVYQVNAIPTILFVDEQGVIRYRGYFTTLNQFEQLLQSYG